VSGSGSIARWNGQAWSRVGAGVTDLQGGFSGVWDMITYDDGLSGPALYVAMPGAMPTGVPAARILAKWNGTVWSDIRGAVADGSSAPAKALAVFDDGVSGPELYVAGSFASIGGVAATNIARWNGVRWATVGGGGITGPGTSPVIRSLCVYDDGSGSALF